MTWGREEVRVFFADTTASSQPFRGSMPGKRPETIRLPSGLEVNELFL